MQVLVFKEHSFTEALAEVKKRMKFSSLSPLFTAARLFYFPIFKVNQLNNFANQKITENQRQNN